MRKYLLLITFLLITHSGSLWAQVACGDDPPEVNISYDGPVCPGETVTLTFDLDDDDDEYDIRYQINGSIFMLSRIIDEGSVQHTINTTTTVVILSVYDYDDDCVATLNESFDLEVWPSPDLKVELTEANCGQSNAQVVLLVDGGTTPFGYRLGTAPFQSNNIFEDLAPGSYPFTVRDANGCTDEQIVTIERSEGPELSISNFTDPDCTGRNGLVELEVNGGQAPFQFGYSGGPQQSSSVFSGLEAGFYTFYVEDANDCRSEVQIELNQQNTGLTEARIDPLPSNQFCQGALADLFANQPTGTTGRWSIKTGEGNFSDPEAVSSVLELVEPGTYFIYWTLSATLCPNYSTDSVLVNVAPAIDARDDGPFFVKNDSVLVIDILGNDRYGGTPSVRILNEAQYGISEWDDGQLRYLSGLNGVGTDEIQYELCATACLICDTATLRITVIADDNICDLVDLPDNIFPEGITPNGDGYNDWLEFIIVDPATCPFEYRQSELIIYNRWGDRVFEQSPYENQWQGTTGQGRELPPGVYYYVLKINREEPFVRFGTVTIFKE